MSFRPTSQPLLVVREAPRRYPRLALERNWPSKLSAEARAAIEDGTNELRVSTVSVWEIAIKQSLGKLDLPKPAERWLPDVLRRSGFEVADVGVSAALRVRSLPWHHRDPFDRLLIAHALEDGYTVVTRDEVFALYGVPMLIA